MEGKALKTQQFKIIIKSQKMEKVAICIVATKAQKDKWQAHMGIIRTNWDEAYAILRTTSSGLKLSPSEAKNFFPDLDIDKYSYFD
jgi:hypothetical protein